MITCITGSSGYLGSRLLKEYPNAHQCDLKIYRDILSYDPGQVGVIYHLAGQADIPYSIENPFKDARDNILGTLKAIELANKYNARLIFSASAASCDIQSPYGLSKKTAEEYIKMLCKDYIILRFSSIFGEKPTGVVDNFIREEKCRINGNGSAIRDFVHINDIIKALTSSQNWKTGTYNCGSGKGVRILDLARATRKEIEFLPKIEGEIQTSILKNDTMDWKPEINVLEFIKSKVVDEK